MVLFVAISGCGWLLDFALFSLAVGLAHWPPGVANLVSATVAALSVFLVSRRLVFRRNDRDWRAVGLYLAYTEANIVFWSLAIQLVSGTFVTWALAPSMAAMLAKIVVTPLSLTANFFVTRLLSHAKP